MNKILDPGVVDFDRVDLDQFELTRFRQYFERYYRELFVYGQGTENILDLLSRFSPGGDWLDIGAGTTTLFWSIPQLHLESISCSDLYVEALSVLRDFVLSDELPGCYADALQMTNRTSRDLAATRKLFSRYYQFDATRPWPASMQTLTFDLITEFGTFGLSKDSAEFVDCFLYLEPHLRSNGRVIGANWIRGPELVEQDGCDNSYLTRQLIEEAARQAMLTLLHFEQVSITGDSSYPSVLMFAMAKQT